MRLYILRLVPPYCFINIVTENLVVYTAFSAAVLFGSLYYKITGKLDNGSIIRLVWEILEERFDNDNHSKVPNNLFQVL